MMPIKDKSLYPSDWPKIRERIRKRAGDKCEKCGVKNHAYGFRDGLGTFFECRDDFPVHGYPMIRIVCTTAHFDHNPANCADENLFFWCQQCHNRHDINHRRHKPPQEEKLL